jgi:hypothetical protein
MRGFDLIGATETALTPFARQEDFSALLHEPVNWKKYLLGAFGLILIGTGLIVLEKR